MKAENYSERRVEVDGWQVNVTSYQLGEKWHAKADNVSPGAGLARAEADTREDAEKRGAGSRARIAEPDEASSRLAGRSTHVKLSWRGGRLARRIGSVLTPERWPSG